MTFDKDAIPTNPHRILALKAKKYKIPIYDSLLAFSNDDRYELYNTQRDYFEIDKAIDTVVQQDRLLEVPPPIIAIVITDTRTSPLIYMIKKDVFIKERKKKITKSNLKRKRSKKITKKVR